MASAAAKTSDRPPASRTPLAAYSESGNPAATPAPGSSSHSTPVLLRTPSAPGTIATRRSPGADSATTPTVIPKNFSDELSVYRGLAGGWNGPKGLAGGESQGPADPGFS